MTRLGSVVYFVIPRLTRFIQPKLYLLPSLWSLSPSTHQRPRHEAPYTATNTAPFPTRTRRLPLVPLYRDPTTGRAQSAVCVSDIDDTDSVFLPVGDIDCADRESLGRVISRILTLGSTGILGSGVRRRVIESRVCESVPLLCGTREPRRPRVGTRSRWSWDRDAE